MKHHIRTTTIGSAIAIALMLFLAACGGKQTVASKSAKAFREARQNGTPIGGDGHGGHSASGNDHGAMTDSAGDHATMTGMDHSTMTGMDHSTMTVSSQTNTAGMDHSKMNMDGQTDTAGMQHGNTQQGQQPMAGMDHGSMPGMQHGAGAAGSVVMSVPTTNVEMQQLRPEATLRADDFDAPVPISVSESMKATQGGGHEMSGSAPAAAMDHSQHGQTAPATPPRTQSRATATPSQAKPVAATVYTCPMHPEVTSDKPGTCPKCGMTLVKKN